MRTYNFLKISIWACRALGILDYTSMCYCWTITQRKIYDMASNLIYKQTLVGELIERN